NTFWISAQKLQRSNHRSEKSESGREGLPGLPPALMQQAVLCIRLKSEFPPSESEVLYHLRHWSHVHVQGLILSSGKMLLLQRRQQIRSGQPMHSGHLLTYGVQYEAGSQGMQENRS